MRRTFHTLPVLLLAFALAPLTASADGHEAKMETGKSMGKTMSDDAKAKVDSEKKAATDKATAEKNKAEARAKAEKAKAEGQAKA